MSAALQARMAALRARQAAPPAPTPELVSSSEDTRELVESFRPVPLALVVEPAEAPVERQIREQAPLRLRGPGCTGACLPKTAYERSTDDGICWCAGHPAPAAPPRRHQLHEVESPQGSRFRARRVALDLDANEVGKALGLQSKRVQDCGRSLIRGPGAQLLDHEQGKGSPLGGWNAYESVLWGLFVEVVDRRLAAGERWNEITFPGAVWTAAEIHAAAGRIGLVRYEVSRG